MPLSIKTKTLSYELGTMDALRGCTPRSVMASEAGWPDDSPVAWPEAYMMAKLRGRTPGADHHDGRTVAFLEGFSAAVRMTRDEP